eukprot:11174293-Lingulodinium_polyedra.AAC.1
MPPAEEPPEAAGPPPELPRPPDAAIRALVQRLHQNLNHPEPKVLARMPQRHGVRPEVVAAARQHRCP